MSDQTERPYNVALSRDEVIALVHYHRREMQSITRKLGKASLDFSKAFELKKLHDMAKAAIDKHAQRGKGLLSIVK